MNNTFHTLEFDHILRQLEELACTKSAKERIRSMEPYLYEGDVRKSQKDTTEARRIIESAGMPPIASMSDVGAVPAAGFHLWESGTPFPDNGPRYRPASE